MPEETVTLHLLEDGTPDYEKLAGHPALVHIKNTLDGLRGSVKQYKEQLAALEAYRQLGSVEELTSLKSQVQQLTAREAELKTALDRIAELEGASKMTEAEKKELEALKAQVEGYAKLGKPEELEAALKDAEYGRSRRLEDRLAKAAEDAGLNPKAFLRLEGVKGLELEYQEVEVQEGGKAVKKALPHVKVDGKLEPLSAFVERTHAEFLPVLRPDSKPQPQPTPTVVLGSARNNGGAPVLLTEDAIKGMSAEEYEKARPQIFEAIKAGQIKP